LREKKARQNLLVGFLDAKTRESMVKPLSLAGPEHSTR
jgi:hypothetical protein